MEQPGATGNHHYMHQKKIIRAGKEWQKGGKTLIMLHGRGATAEDILSLSAHLAVNDFTLLAPQATNNTWYPYSFLMPPQKNEPWLSSALSLLKEMVSDLEKQGAAAKDIFFLGFSQGACLTLEFTARNATRYGGIIAFTGGLIGDRIYQENYKGSFDGTPVFIGCSDADPHVPVQRAYATANILKGMKASVTEKIYPNMGHTINEDEIKYANLILSGKYNAP